jgi:hypothetical protein
MDYLYPDNRIPTHVPFLELRKHKQDLDQLVEDAENYSTFHRPSIRTNVGKQDWKAVEAEAGRRKWKLEDVVAFHQRESVLKLAVQADALAATIIQAYTGLNDVKIRSGPQKQGQINLSTALAAIGQIAARTKIYDNDQKLLTEAANASFRWNKMSLTRAKPDDNGFELWTRTIKTVAAPLTTTVEKYLDPKGFRWERISSSGQEARAAEIGRMISRSSAAGVVQEVRQAGVVAAREGASTVAPKDTRRHGIWTESGINGQRDGSY